MIFNQQPPSSGGGGGGETRTLTFNSTGDMYLYSFENGTWEQPEHMSTMQVAVGSPVMAKTIGNLRDYADMYVVQGEEYLPVSTVVQYEYSETDTSARKKSIYTFLMPDGDVEIYNG